MPKFLLILRFTFLLNLDKAEALPLFHILTPCVYTIRALDVKITYCVEKPMSPA